MENCSQIMGIPVPKVTMEETVTIIDQVITEKKAELFHVVTLNPEITMSSQHDLLLRSIIDEAGHLTADGAGIVMVSRLKGSSSNPFIGDRERKKMVVLSSGRE